ncbi:hypothetical protein [Anaerococcus sp. Marseille-P3915]|uniref:hypothetical protein n=2 Tax=Anaerococcus TaxID=165779 RepID=UPI000D0B1EB4|nr:hypothetical protein [Anaerococcus sp. Marseille-P3915]
MEGVAKRGCKGESGEGTCGTFPWLSPFGEVISLMTIIYYEMTLRRKILYNNIILDNKTQISSILIKEVLREMLPKLI